MSLSECPLCGGAGRPFASAHGRDFLRCGGDCLLVFVARAQLPSAGREGARYRLHRNDPADEGYRRFLSKLADAVATVVPPGAHGLDYGCGPTPVLAQLLAERGLPTVSYDPMFFSDAELLRRTYDFVTCNEVAEHFHLPSRDFARLAALTGPGGVLAVRTQPPPADFAAWPYARDFTHVAFYSPQTFGWLARAYGFSLRSAPGGIFLLTAGGR